MTENEVVIKNNLISHFPGSVNKSGQVFNSFIDAMVKGFSKAETFLEEYSKNYNIDEFNDDMLNTFTKFFGLPEMDYFTASENLKKFRVLFNRETTKWGSLYDIMTIVKKHYELDTVYLIENVSDENLLIDGDFESVSSTAWEMPNDQSTYKTPTASFEGLYGVKLLSGGWVQQTVTLNAGTYDLHFFMQGAVKVRFCQGENIVREQPFSSNEWKDQHISFSVTTTTDMTFCFLYDNEICFIDYVRLSHKHTFPTFSVCAVFQSGSSGNTLYMQPEEISSLNNLKFMNHSYFPALNGSTYIRDALNFIVNYIRPVGVKCYGNVLIKQQGDQEDYVLNGVLYTFSGSILDETYDTTNSKSVNNGVYNT